MSLTEQASFVFGELESDVIAWLARRHQELVRVTAVAVA
jgi:hypothetical protein